MMSINTNSKNPSEDCTILEYPLRSTNMYNNVLIIDNDVQQLKKAFQQLMTSTIEKHIYPPPPGKTI